MLQSAERWGGGDAERPFLPRAFSVLRVNRTPPARELHFLIEDVGPGTKRLCELEPGEELLLVGPLGNGFTRPRDDREPLLVGGGVGIAPLAIWQDELEELDSHPPSRAGGIQSQALLGFRDRAHAAGAALLSGPVVATDDGSVGHHGLVTDLLEDELDERAERVEVYACGPPAMLEVVRTACVERKVPAQLALESGMACGFGACFGLRRADRRRLRPVVRRRPGPGRAAARDRGNGRGGTLTVEFCGLELEHPVINGSGTFDAIAARRAFGDELIERFPFSAFVSKTVTLEPRQGNPPPRLWEVAGGLINSIGLPNKGLAGYLERDLPELARLPVPLIVNVMGFSRNEVARLVEAFAAREEVGALELNVSCPNVETGLTIGADPGEIAALLHEVRPLTRKPLIVKLTPNATDVPAVARAAEGAGADAVSLINTLRGMALDPATGRPWLGGTTGGVSGPAVRPIALAQVHAVAREVEIPIVGMGGVQRGADALDLMRAGASLVAVGTESFRDPVAGLRVAGELSELLAKSVV